MRQAVVIIHGIGNQLPMSTLRRFVKAVIERPQPDGLPFYSKPDRISDTLELRRLTANKKYTGGNPTDFYELYWQHLMTGTTFAHIQAWLWILLLRGLHLDPLRRYKRIIVVGHSLGSVIAYDVLTHLWQEMHSKVERSSQRNGKPELEELDYPESEPTPSPIGQPALDALTTLESMMHREPPADKSKQLELNRQYRQHQRALWAEYKNFDFPWRITDLVTLGSPLTYAEFLLANNLGEFSEAKDQREFPTCPPRPEDERDDKDKPGERGYLKRVHAIRATEGKAIDERRMDQSGRCLLRILHHGALFACTRWTNLYFPGDIIGGPLSFVGDPSSPNLAGRVERFGLGVHDVRVDGSSANRLISHVKYWAEGEEQAVKALRAVLDLGEKD